MTTLQIEVRGLDAVLRKLRPELYRPALRDWLTRAALLAEKTAKQEAPKDTHALARSITSEVRPLLARVFSTLAYAEWVEMGRRAGARMPPPRALEGWIRRHGLSVSPFVLARAIARRGIRGRFFMAKTRQTVAHALPAMARDAARAVERVWRR